MKVLLLGARGMLGHALQKHFAPEELTAWDKEELDITDREMVLTTIGELKPELIINAAAYTNVDGAEDEREIAFLVNRDGVRNIAEAAKAVDATMVHYSTDYVFPGMAENGYGEDDTPGPASNAYGESKLAGEQALADIAPRSYLIRTAWLYGPHGKNFVDTMLRLADEKDQLRVINDQHGSPTYAEDLAMATYQLVNGEFVPGVYHLVNDGVATWYELARTALETAGKATPVVPITTDEYPTKARRPRFSVLRNIKGPKLRPWQQAVESYIRTRSV